MHYSSEDIAWINRKAAQFADQSEHVDEMALSLAKAEFQKLSQLPKAEVIPISQTDKAIEER